MNSGMASSGNESRPAMTRCGTTMSGRRPVAMRKIAPHSSSEKAMGMPARNSANISENSNRASCIHISASGAALRSRARAARLCTAMNRPPAGSAA